MQGQRSAVDSFTETVDLNQDLYNDANMDHSTAWNNVLIPAERRLSHNARSFSGWDVGESSSSANLRDPISSDGLKMEHGWSSPYGVCPATETRSEERRFEPPNILHHDRVSSGLVGNQITWGHLNVHTSGSDHYPADINLNDRYPESDDEDGEGIFPSFFKSGRLVTEPNPPATISSGGGGTSSEKSGYNDDGSSSSMGNWGSSCKRKAVEGGTSAQPYPSGNTTLFPQAENNVPHGSPARHNASSSLSISSAATNYPGFIHSEQLNSRFGVGMRGFVADVSPPLSFTGTRENSSRNSGARLNLGHQEPAPFNFPPPGNATRHSVAGSLNQSSRSISSSDPLEFGPIPSLQTSLSNFLNQPYVVHSPGPFLTRNLPISWNDAGNLRASSSSSSLTFPGERSTGIHEDAGFRSNIRNNEDHPMFVPVTQTRNLVEDPTSWSLGTGSLNAPGGGTSSSQAGPSSSSHPSSTGWPHQHNSITHNHPRVSDFAPWCLFPSGESESSVRRRQFSPFASGPPSSPEEPAMSSQTNSQGHHQPYPRSAYLMEVSGDDANGWRTLAADINGRQRLVSEIRQVLNAMRRGENLRAEDYMLFDPFINGVAELHDRHRDMRLDVDNMSYEELLALEERIGNVNTGLSEDVILQSMKERQFTPIGLPSLEPCCICQEEYAVGETIGTLDCGHDFHSNCVKQWLQQKNICPICKMTGIGT